MLGNTYELAGKFKSYMHGNKEVDLKFRFDPMFDQTYGSIGLLVLFNGLQFIFEDLQYKLPGSKEEILAQGGPEMLIGKVQNY